MHVTARSNSRPDTLWFSNGEITQPLLMDKCSKFDFLNNYGTLIIGYTKEMLQMSGTICPRVLLSNV